MTQQRGVKFDLGEGDSTHRQDENLFGNLRGEGETKLTTGAPGTCPIGNSGGHSYGYGLQEPSQAGGFGSMEANAGLCKQWMEQGVCDKRELCPAKGSHTDMYSHTKQASETGSDDEFEEAAPTLEEIKQELEEYKQEIQRQSAHMAQQAQQSADREAMRIKREGEIREQMRTSQQQEQNLRDNTTKEQIMQSMEAAKIQTEIAHRAEIERVKMEAEEQARQKENAEIHRQSMLREGAEMETEQKARQILEL